MDLTEDEFVALEEYFGKDLDGHQPDEGTDSEVDADTFGRMILRICPW